MSLGYNWAGYHAYRAKVLHRPETIPEVQELVAASPRVRALGTRHSFNDLADSVGDLVSLDALDPSISIHPGARTVSCSGGLRYGHLAAALEAEGWAIHNLASLPHISVAGAIATGTHGSGNNNGSLSSGVAALELVTASGDLLRTDRTQPDFDGMVVSLGALGVVTRVWLDIEPTFEMRQDVYEGLGWPELTANFDAVTASAYSVSVFTNWNSISAVWLKSRTDAAAPPTELFGATQASGERHPIARMPAENTTAQRGIPGRWNERLAHFKLGFTPSTGDELQSEYIVPREHALAAIEAVRGLRTRVTPLVQVSELRTMAADSLWLSGAYETDAVGIHFTWFKRPGEVLAVLPAIEAALEPFRPRPHWGKLFHAIGRDAYPRLDDFSSLARRLDPTGKFRNDYLDAFVP